jgi:hypothetical protein
MCFLPNIFIIANFKYFYSFLAVTSVATGLTMGLFFVTRFENKGQLHVGFAQET